MVHLACVLYMIYSESLLMLHNIFCTHFEKTLSQPSGRFGELFLMFIPHLEIYAEFIRNHENSLKVYPLTELLLHMHDLKVGLWTQACIHSICNFGCWVISKSMGSPILVKFATPPSLVIIISSKYQMSRRWVTPTMATFRLLMIIDLSP